MSTPDPQYDMHADDDDDDDGGPPVDVADYVGGGVGADEYAVELEQQRVAAIRAAEALKALAVDDTAAEPAPAAVPAATESAAPAPAAASPAAVPVAVPAAPAAHDAAHHDPGRHVSFKEAGLAVEVPPPAADITTAPTLRSPAAMAAAVADAESAAAGAAEDAETGAAETATAGAALSSDPIKLFSSEELLELLQGLCGKGHTIGLVGYPNVRL